MPVEKIIFNNNTVNATEKVVENLEQKVNRGLTRLTTKSADSYDSLRKTINPFYNRFLPKFLRRTVNLEFYPNSQVIKSRNVYNADEQIIKSQLFNELGHETYFETNNPKTGYSFMRVKSEDKVIEQEMQKNILLRKEEKDINGFTIYRKTFDPKTNITTVIKDKDGIKTVRKTVANKEIYSSTRDKNGEITEVYTDIQTKRRSTVERKYIILGSGEVSRKPLLKKLTILDNDGSLVEYDYIRGRGFKYSVFDVEGNKLNEEQYIEKSRMEYILKETIANINR